MSVCVYCRIIHVERARFFPSIAVRRYARHLRAQGLGRKVCADDDNVRLVCAHSFGRWVTLEHTYMHLLAVQCLYWSYTQNVCYSNQ